MGGGHMRHFLGQAHGQADVDAVAGMAQRRLAGLARIGPPALHVLRVELPDLADVVAEAARDQEIAIDRHIGKRPAISSAILTASRVTERMWSAWVPRPQRLRIVVARRLHVADRA